MRIEFENKFLDILVFNQIHQFLSVVMQVFVVLVALLILWSEINAGVNLACAFLIAGMAYIAIWVVQFIFNIFYFYSRRNKTVLTRHTVEIQEEAFYEETIFNRSYSYWNGIEKIVKRPGFIAVYITPHTAHIIPRRAFNSKTEMLDFYKECKSRVSKAQPRNTNSWN